MRNRLLLVIASATITSCIVAQSVPEALYYRFNEGSGTTTVNAASPGAGAPVATMTGIGFGAGQFGSGLVGTGLVGPNQLVNTGYTLNLAGLSWTLEFWWKPNLSANGLQYIFGVNVGGSFRCFSGSVTAAPGALTLTGSGLGTINAAGAVIANVWTHVAYVFDNSSNPPTVRPFVNGVGGAAVAQTAALTLGTGAFNIGSQISGTSGLNGVMDEFRLWTHARTAAEIAATYNTEVFNYNLLSATTTGGGVGDLALSLTLISPGAIEGYLLVSSTTSGAVGTGPFLGIEPDAVTFALLQEPLNVGDPLHYVVGPTGVFPAQPFALPAGSLLLGGQVWDAVAVLFAPGLSYLGHSNVQRLVW